MEALLLPVGDDVYALETAAVREVVAGPGLATLPTAPPSVLGVLNLRGEIVPVFDLAALLGLGSTHEVPFVAVVDTSLGPAGLALTRMAETALLGEPIAATETAGTIATYSIGRQLAVLIDVATLLVPANVAT
ncbi:MAG: chemotaxis protein CheW [Acidimicrobiales bacterium]|nr:chemotaxis protein CheW [Acidimicrobiales bacterium]